MRLIIPLFFCLANALAAQAQPATFPLDLLGWREKGLEHYVMHNYRVLVARQPKIWNSSSRQAWTDSLKQSQADTIFENPALASPHVASRKKVEVLNSGYYCNISTYLLPTSAKTSRSVTFYTNYAPNDSLETIFLQLLLACKLPKKLGKKPNFEPQMVKQVDFLGHRSWLTGSCYLSGHNPYALRCGHSTLEWETHPTMAMAEALLTARQEEQASYSNYKVEKIDWLDARCDGLLVPCKRIKYTFVPSRYETPLQSVIDPGSKTQPGLPPITTRDLVCYYLATEIRGHIITCILRHYADATLSPNGIPAELDKFIQVKN